MSEDLLRVEEALVSWAMVDTRAAIDHGIHADWFLDGRCRQAWEAIGSIAQGGTAEAPPWVLFERMGGGELIQSWCQRLAGVGFLEKANWVYWSDRMRELYVERMKRDAAQRMTTKLKKAKGTDDQDAAVAEFQQTLSSLPSASSDRPPTLVTVLRNAVSSLGKRVDARAKGLSGNLGIPTGVRWLDDKLGGGWQRGCVSILAGRTSHGKSTVAQIAALEAARNGHGVHYVCLEDGAEMFGARVLAQAGGVPVGNFFAGDMGGDAKEAVAKLAEVNEAVSAQCERRSPLHRFLFDTKRSSVEEIVGRVERERVANQTSVVFIDYLGLVSMGRGDDRHREVEHAVTRLQQAAIEQNVAYVVLHQLNRKFADRQNKQPVLTDLRDSGAIEERAVAVVFAHRPNVDDGADDKGGTSEVDDMHLVLAKNKFGPRNCLAKFRVNFARYRIEGAA